MDESVKRALAKWPNVPDCYGWLKLDRRGQWGMRAPDAEPPVWGPILHEKLMDFIHRNYQQDDDGSYVFQNGPQKVRVELAYTPFVFHLPGGELTEFSVLSSGRIEAGKISAAWIDDSGSIVLRTELGVGLLDDRDLALALEWIRDESGAELSDDQLSSRFEAYIAGQHSDGLSLAGVAIESLKAANAPRYFKYTQIPAKPPTD
jgi:hypothetical protein